MKRKVNNTVKPQLTVKNNVPADTSRRSLKIVFDFSMGLAFNSCTVGDFNNFLKSETDFVDKFRQILTAVHKLSEKTVAELFDTGSGYRHCHSVQDKESAVLTVLKKLYGFDDDFLTQNYGGEKFYQAGLEKGVRFIGTIAGNVFRIHIVDYFHDLYPDDRRNIRAGKTHRYSLNANIN